MESKSKRLKAIFAILSLTLVCGAFSIVNAQRQPKPRTTPIVAAAPVAPEINYTISMSKPATHLLEIEMRLRSNPAPERIEISMPVWTPGSYLIREYARHVIDFGVKDQSGNQLAWNKTNKNTWQVETKNATEIIVSYKVYANELTVRTNELNDEHAFITPAALLMHPKNFINAPSTVRVVPFENWKVATGLPAVAGQTNVFRAANFDVLYDSPFEIADFKEISFTVFGKPHRIVVTGEGNYDLERLRRDIQKIVETTAAIFNNELPYENYLFIINLRGGGGGLEHLNSTALQFPRFGFTGPRYIGFLGLVAHEYFHLWNVKRIRPDALGPFDYANENYTKSLWIAEGGTEYFSNLIVRRAGFVSDKQFLGERAAGIAALQNRPGRFEQSLEESSFDAWIKYYRPDENSINREISYYDKGELVNMLLDLTIRRKTGGAKNLDDVMRGLFNDFYRNNRNYTPQDFQKVAETAAGANLDDFFRRYVRGRDEIDWNAGFEPFGLKLEKDVPNAPPQTYLGAEFRQQGDLLTIATIPVGTPAYDNGLNTGDVILAVDGYRIANQNDLNARLADRKPGDKIKLTLYRFDRLRELEITLGARAPEQYRFVASPNASNAQKELYQGWLGAELR